MFLCVLVVCLIGAVLLSVLSFVTSVVVIIYLLFVFDSLGAQDEILVLLVFDAPFWIIFVVCAFLTAVLSAIFAFYVLLLLYTRYNRNKLQRKLTEGTVFEEDDALVLYEAPPVEMYASEENPNEYLANSHRQTDERMFHL